MAFGDKFKEKAGTSTSASEEAKGKLDEIMGGTEGEDTGMDTKSIDWGKYMDGGDDFRKSYRYNQARRRNTGPAINTKIGDVYRNKKDFTFLGNYIQDSLGESLERMSKHGTLGNLKKKK
jgi:hypothetical protein